MNLIENYIIRNSEINLIGNFLATNLILDIY